MASLKELRTRITSVKSTRQITSAMKMVSAAKLKRAQDAIVQMRPYANKMKEILQNVSATLDSSEGVYSQQREVKNVLLVAITSNRGLCGGFNSNVIKRTNLAIKEDFANANVEVLPIGKKAFDAFKKTQYMHKNTELAKEYNSIFDNLDYEHVAPIAETIMQRFVAGDYDKIMFIYNQFKNAATQVVQLEQFLPLVPESSENTQTQTEYIFQPNKNYIIEDLIPKSLKVQLYKALLDSNASEHGARMTAMHQATDNATDLINSLTLSYNKARQASITNEILEIVAGAEALN
jgi:F-type H+-transporting ATPase subunit gamma